MSVTRTMLDQIGIMYVLAISGGRVRKINENTIHLPVSHGYVVEIEYDPVWDHYIVRRVFIRKKKRFVKGEVKGVYFTELAETAYRAHAYQSYEFGDPVVETSA
jgi:hypothetical protein